LPRSPRSWLPRNGTARLRAGHAPQPNAPCRSSSTTSGRASTPPTPPREGPENAPHPTSGLLLGACSAQGVPGIWVRRLGGRGDEPDALQRCQKLRIVTFGISGGRSLKRPLRDARRFPSTRSYSVPKATRTRRQFGRCTWFKGHLCWPAPNPYVTIRNFLIDVRAWGGLQWLQQRGRR
jgi:hypothetical protein